MRMSRRVSLCIPAHSQSPSQSHIKVLCFVSVLCVIPKSSQSSLLCLCSLYLFELFQSHLKVLCFVLRISLCHLKVISKSYQSSLLCFALSIFFVSYQSHTKVHPKFFALYLFVYSSTLSKSYQSSLLCSLCHTKAISKSYQSSLLCIIPKSISKSLCKLNNIYTKAVKAKNVCPRATPKYV